MRRPGAKTGAGEQKAGSGRPNMDGESAAGDSARAQAAGGFSTKLRRPSAGGRAPDSFSRADGLAGRMDTALRDGETRRLPDLGMALQSMLAFWLLYMALVTLRALVLQYPQFWEMMARRLAAAAVGVAITFLVYLSLRRLRHASLGTRALVAGILCLPASLLFTAFNYFVFYVYAPLDAAKTDMSMHGLSPLAMALRTIAETALSWYFLFAAWSALYVAMSTQRQLRAADRRAADLAREAQDAQLRALRYQINPHFLFNTLNSLSSLILAQRTDTAERMLMNLSRFFRTTLSADPTADVPLAEEIALQRLYLDIEQIRFPDRLHVEIDVPQALLGALVPVLILQPAVENAVKYGVARSRRAVRVRITAHEEAGRLHIKVKDDGEAGGAAGEGGTGVGLRNVCERLETRFGPRAGCLHGPDPGGGYTVHLYMPAVRDG
jgi:two-component system, LytTR family, sensor kinase